MISFYEKVLRLYKVTVFSRIFEIFVIVFEFFEKQKNKAINELSRQLESIYIIKQYIITLFFNDYEFEIEITRKNPWKVDF